MTDQYDYQPVELAPHLSARTAFTRKAKIRLALITAAVALAAIYYRQQVPPLLTTVLAMLYLVSTFDRNWLLLRGLRATTMVTVSDDEAFGIPDDELPTYTVLLPVYDEPSIVHNLVNGVGKLDYPADKLEVLLLVEEDDKATQSALLGVPLQAVRIVVVPHSLPKTKPKACNYGMATASRGSEMMTIYDAEDIPDPLQLRRAVAGFRRLPPDVGCLQARLGYFNERQNLLTRWFALEYDQWFAVVLPAVQGAQCVVPLGGTSNHMLTRVWRELGGWDEFNVTEDADLGVRLARHGYGR
jgi:cellulose synthase/poly-beta-1,6-N-acetylglucosamine synthase-like glycosyltransferase